ncbi:MAG: BatA domain-containing protein, partial [Planctomycetota bacterium]
MLEFARPGFLYALPLALIPLLIHLLHRRRYRRVRWAAMRFLMRAERRSRRRIRLQ